MANTKLTLSMEPEVVYRAKEYAKKRHISLSKLIQDYLDQLSKYKPDPDNEIDSDILELTGILKGKISDDLDLKEARYQYLKHKHGL
ncbi:MAG: DUF6364 family protein [Pedobacter sp.]|nr:DUF6364 family protein [Pedobacter sp.]